MFNTKFSIAYIIKPCSASSLGAEKYLNSDAEENEVDVWKRKGL
jgi:hypothetical protein